MQSAKETASNIAASAKAGMDKTKATMQEKAEKMTTRDPMQKEMATQKKEQRIDEAEMNKQEARGQHAVGHAAHAGAHTGHHTTAGSGTVPYSTTGATGHPTGNVSEDVMGSHPVGGGAGAGTGTGTGGTYDATMRADAPRHADRDSYI